MKRNTKLDRLLNGKKLLLVETAYSVLISVNVKYPKERTLTEGEGSIQLTSFSVDQQLLIF
jgi:hypothetical protein